MDVDAIVSQQKQLECGPMPRVMVALPDIGGVLYSTPHSLADAHYTSFWQLKRLVTLLTYRRYTNNCIYLSRVPCSNVAKTRNPLKFAGVPQTTGSISVASGPKFTILWGHLEDILLPNKFFPIVDTCLSCEDIARQSYAMVPRWRFLATFCMSYFKWAVCSTFQTCILNSH